MENDNVGRAHRAGEVLDYYDANERADPDSNVVDLLADLMHYCARTANWNFDSALETARMHFEAERDEEEQEKCPVD